MSDNTDLDLTPDVGADQPGPETANNNDPEGRPETAARPQSKPEPEEPQWLKNRIARATRYQKEAEEERDRHRAEAEDLRRKLAQYEPPQNDNRPQPPTEQQIRTDERQRQAAAAEEQAFNAKCLEVAQKAAGAYGQDGFNASFEGWQRAGLDLKEKGHVSLLRDIVSLPDAEHLYQHIGSDPNLAATLLDMPEKQAYAELAAISRAKPWAQQAVPAQDGETDEEPVPTRFPAPQMSQAPRPVARGPAPARVSSRSLYDRDIPLSEFMDKRNNRR